MNASDSQTPNVVGGYSAFSSAWHALVFGHGDVRKRLANAMMRAVSVPPSELSTAQLHLFQHLRADRFIDHDENQMCDLVKSLKETKLHELTETIARLYFVTVFPDES